VLIALAVLSTTALILVTLVTLARCREQRSTRPRHTVSGPLNLAAVTVTEIQQRLRRDAAQAQAARTRPPRRVHIVPRAGVSQ
jgi:hypothetical protein